jgi:glutamine amidotransferase
VLGICLGMQLLFESTAEGDTGCLGILPGRASRLSPAESRPVPHMGWNQLESLRPEPLLAGIIAGDYAYFVHSYALPPGPDTVASCEYGGPFTAVVRRGNFCGAQFHPERSAVTGARLLANFLALAA